MDVKRLRNIKRAEAVFVKLGLHMLPQQVAVTIPTKPRKKINKANSQASRKSKRVRVGTETNHEEEVREEPQLRESPEKEEAKRDEAGVIFYNEWDINGSLQPNDRGEVETRRQGNFYDDSSLVWLLAR
jgi:hypothetical protein